MYFENLFRKHCMLAYQFPGYSCFSCAFWFQLCLLVSNMQDFMEIVFIMRFQNSLIVMQFVCHAIHPLKARNSIVVFSQLCSHISLDPFSSPEKEKGSVVTHFLQTLKPLSSVAQCFHSSACRVTSPISFYSHSSLSGMGGRVAFTAFLFQCLHS